MELLEKYSPVDFTSIELTVIHLICRQYFDSEIAKLLSLKPRTVQVVRKKIKSKMNVKSSAGIVVYAIKNNIYHVLLSSNKN